MVFCKKCGKVSPDGTKFCGECGNPLNNEAEVKVEATVIEQSGEISVAESEAKCWRVFAKVGFILGLIGFIMSCTLILGVYGCALGGYGLVFSILGKRTKLPEYKSKANKGLVFSILAMSIGFVGYIAFVVACACLGSMVETGSTGEFTQFIKIFLMNL